MEPLRSLFRRRLFSLSAAATRFEQLVGLLLRIGTLVLLVFLVLFILRLFQDQGYVLESFSVPKKLEEAGYNGRVVALRIQDEVAALKELAGSIKDDSLDLQGVQEDLKLDVLGFGLSLRSVTYHLRAILGRQNQTVQGEITRLGARYELKLRMTNYPTKTIRLRVDSMEEGETLDRLFRLAGEKILQNTDPYRLALICTKEKRYEEGIDFVREMLRNRPGEAHWAFLAWGNILERQNRHEASVEKYRRATEVNPDFSLGWLRMALALDNVDRIDEAVAAMRRVVALEPNNPWRFNSLGWILAHNGEYNGADSAFRQALSLASTTEERIGISFNWAEMKINQNDFSGANAIVEQYGEDIGQSAIGYLAKAMIAFTAKDTAAAVRNAYEAFELDPSMPGATHGSMTAATWAGDYEKMIEIYRRAESYDEGPWHVQQVTNQAAMAFNYLGRHDSAFALVRRAIRVDPTVGYPYSTLAETYAFTDQLDSCWYFLDKAFSLGLRPENLDTSLPPYPFLTTQPEFKELMDKYGRDLVD